MPANCIRCHKPMGDFPFCPHCGARQEQRKSSARTRANGEGTVFRRGPTWTARVIVGWKHTDGQKRPVTKSKGGFKTKKAALDYCVILRNSPSTADKVPTLYHYWELYSSGKMEKLSDSKRTAYKIAWEKMTDLHFIPVNLISFADLSNTVRQAAPTYYPARDMKSLLKHLYRLAAAEKYASMDLPNLIELPEKQETEREAFSEIEQAQLWKAYETGEKRAALSLVMIYTGMMPGELLQLDISMIDYDAREIHHVGLKTEVRRKSAIYLPDDIVPLLQELHEGRDSGRVLTISRDQFYADYYAALEAAGCRRLTPYSCRHTTATRLAITEQIAPQTIRKVMRWSTTKMLDRYAHPDAEDAKTAANTLNRKPEK